MVDTNDLKEIIGSFNKSTNATRKNVISTLEQYRKLLKKDTDKNIIRYLAFFTRCNDSQKGDLITFFKQQMRISKSFGTMPSELGGIVADSKKDVTPDVKHKMFPREYKE